MNGCVYRLLDKSRFDDLLNSVNEKLNVKTNLPELVNAVISDCEQSCCHGYRQEVLKNAIQEQKINMNHLAELVEILQRKLKFVQDAFEKLQPLAKQIPLDYEYAEMQSYEWLRSATDAIERAYSNGSYPYGYRFDRLKDKLIPLESAELVAEMYFLYLDGRSVASIVKLYNENEFDGISWSETTVQRILTNPVYTGCLVVGKSKTDPKTGKRIRLKPKDWIVIPNQHEPIISKELFEALQEEMKLRRSRAS